MFYTYVLQSEEDSELYIGFTDNLEKRLHEHNSGNVRSTKSRKPFKLIYFEGCLKKDLAIKREKQLKTGFGRKYIKMRTGVL